MAEEFAGEVTAVQVRSESWLIACALRGMDDDAQAFLSQNTSVGTNAGRVGLDWPGPKVPGTFREADALPLLFVPEDPVNHPAVYFRSAVPEFLSELEINLAGGEEWLMLCRFRAFRQNQGGSPAKSVQVQIMEDLVIP